MSRPRDRRRASRTVRSRRPGRGGGFTLVELVAVMIIVAIMAGVAVPMLSRVDDSRAAAAAKHLLRDLTFARQRAVATGHRCWVAIDAGAGTWSILAEDPNAPGRGGAAVITDMASGRPYTVDLDAEYPGVSIAGVDFDSGVEIGFNWVGAPYVGDTSPLSADGTVTFAAGQVITVVSGTGAIIFAAP